MTVYNVNGIIFSHCNPPRSSYFFFNPIGIAFDSKGNFFYVADEGNNTVNKFDMNYRHIERIHKLKETSSEETSSEETNLPLTFTQLRGIAVSSKKGLIFVTEPIENRIVCFNTKGMLVKVAKEWNNRDFVNPQVVALDPDDTVLYVGDDSGQLHSIELDVFIQEN